MRPPSRNYLSKASGVYYYSANRSSFFFNATTTTKIYTLSLHDALPISRLLEASTMKSRRGFAIQRLMNAMRQAHADGKECRSEERFSRNAETDLVCRLLLEKKKKAKHNKPTSMIRLSRGINTKSGSRSA